MLNGQAGRLLSDDPDRSAVVVDAGENLTRSLRSSLTADEERGGGESIRDNANFGHKLLQ
jgi:hypothetical protein